MPESSFPFSFNRDRCLQQLGEVAAWDLIVIGGGATGLGIAVDAANRGLKTLLLERCDFAKGTSSRSTKLVHGGVRYLAQGNISLVFEALQERGYMLRNAPHLVSKQAFIIPCYSGWALSKYWIGLKLYDWLSGMLSFGASQYLKPQAVLEQLPGIRPKNLKGGILYWDGQFDDARLAINLAQTAAQEGATVLNYMQVIGFLKQKNTVTGVEAIDAETGAKYALAAKTVVNATGVFVDELLQLDEPGKPPLVRPSQGIHIVLNRSFLPADAALMIPQTTDGRVLFALPWHRHLMVGTTDTPLGAHATEPAALEQEIDFVLHNMGQYVMKPPTRKDVLSVYAGLRPLAAPQKKGAQTKEISRSHKLLQSQSGLITITGGKWTTYRKMAEAVVDLVQQKVQGKTATCRTKRLNIHGYEVAHAPNAYKFYGSDAHAIEKLVAEEPALEKKLVPGHPYTEAMVVWAVKSEMARTVEDVLARRIRLLFLDAKAALQAATRVAQIMAPLLDKDEAWQQAQVRHFQKLAKAYLLPAA